MVNRVFLTNKRGLFTENIIGLPWWLSGKKICLQCRRPGFYPWVWKIPWRRKWQPTPVFLPGEFHGQRSLAGYSPWGSQRVRHDLATKQHIHALTGLISLLSKGFSGVFSSATDQRHLFFAHKGRSNQSILREINPEYLLESLMLKLKLQFFGQLMRTANSLEKSLMLGKIEGRRRRG